MSFSRSERRHHTRRLLRKFFVRELRGVAWSDDKDKAEWALWRARKQVNTRTVCSCSMCCSARKTYGNSLRGLTRQELRSVDELRNYHLYE